jgi:2-polyprenyl-3-methyl-5-hydroxy-6-metoxy-1,4-benzoquinol methylase
VSVCAGDGRDLLGALMNHSRAQDVKARLVELDERLVECGRIAATGAGLAEQLEFVGGDATMSSAYEGMVPADLVLVCGVFGHVTEAETPRLVRNLSFLCKPGGFVIWTRRRNDRDSTRHTSKIQNLLHEAAFEEVCFEVTPEGKFGVSTYRYLGEPLTLPNDQQLFEFSEFSGALER